LAAAVPVGAIIFLPSLYFRGVSVLLANGIPAVFSLEPLGVAILGLCTGIMMARARVSGRRWLAAGMLLAFGIQTFLYSCGTQFGIAPPQTAGTAGIAGMAGGLMLVTAGVLGAVGIAADRATPDLAGNQDISDLLNTFRGAD
jgi:hypothetical protein